MDSFDPNADFCARLPVAPIISDYVTNLIVNEEISRKRKHKAFVTSQASEALDGTRDSLVSDDGTITDDEAYEKQQNAGRAAANEHGNPKKPKKDAHKAKKTSSGAQSSQEKGGKKSEKAPKKKPEVSSAQKKSKVVTKKPKTDKAPAKSSQSSSSSAEAGNSQPSSSSFRPQYESVFSR